MAHLLGEGARSLEPFREPALAERVAQAGVAEAVDDAQAALLGLLVDGVKIGLLDGQAQEHGEGYGAANLGRDVLDVVWGDLADDSRTARVLRQAWIDVHAQRVEDWAGAAQSKPEGLATGTAVGIPPEAMVILCEMGDDTPYRAWLRAALPTPSARLAEAAAAAGLPDDRRLILEDMAAQVETLAATLG